jgi:hypothetical protein
VVSLLEIQLTAILDELSRCNPGSPGQAQHLTSGTSIHLDTLKTSSRRDSLLETKLCWNFLRSSSCLGMRSNIQLPL